MGLQGLIEEERMGRRGRTGGRRGELGGDCRRGSKRRRKGSLLPNSCL
jgi:hypothetical protein